MLLTNQEFSVISGGSTTSYFQLEKKARQGDPISAYLFITTSEIILAMIKSTQNMKGLFSKNDQKSTSKLMKTYTFGLTPHISKYEAAVIGSLKWV